MPKDAMFTLKLEPELRDRFMAAAAAAEQPASQVVRALMRDFIEAQAAAKAHDAWFRDAVEQGMREADDATVQRLPQEEVALRWRRQRAALRKRAGDQAE